RETGVRKVAVAAHQAEHAPAVHLGEHAGIAQTILVLAEWQPVGRTGPDGVDVHERERADHEQPPAKMVLPNRVLLSRIYGEHQYRSENEAPAVAAEHDQLLRRARPQDQRAEENQQQGPRRGCDPEPALELPRPMAA